MKILILTQKESKKSGTFLVRIMWLAEALEREGHTVIIRHNLRVNFEDTNVDMVIYHRLWLSLKTK